jgi:hypothetical protein
MRYDIVRTYFRNHSSRVIMRGLTLEQAQAHCKDPETSSSTCQSAEKIRYTNRVGAWFDGYRESK